MLLRVSKLLGMLRNIQQTLNVENEPCSLCYDEVWLQNTETNLLLLTKNYTPVVIALFSLIL